MLEIFASSMVTYVFQLVVEAAYGKPISFNNVRRRMTSKSEMERFYLQPSRQQRLVSYQDAKLTGLIGESALHEHADCSSREIVKLVSAWAPGLHGKAGQWTIRPGSRHFLSATEAPSAICGAVLVIAPN